MDGENRIILNVGGIRYNILFGHHNHVYCFLSLQLAHIHIIMSITPISQANFRLHIHSSSYILKGII